MMTEVATRAVSVQLNGVSKTYGGHVTAVNGVSLRVNPGELVTLLGPSGSGKTTLLRMIAGFEEITAGEILIDDSPVSRVPTHRRRLGMVAQDYALFPHMTVAENLAFGIRSAQRHWTEDARLDKKAIDADIERMLELVGLAGLRSRRPHQLSGGQKQRVALARALVTRPRILLLDEPFAALDKKLREQLQVEVRQLQRHVGITTVFVTHDQGEALSMSDRIAVLHEGRLEQYDTPRAIYERPATRFVADFIGRSNFLSGSLVDRTGTLGRVRLTDGTTITVPVGEDATPGSRVEVSIRPERFVLRADPAEVSGTTNVLRGTVSHVVYLGDSIQVRVSTGVGDLVVALASAQPAALATGIGDAVALCFDPPAAIPIQASAGS